MYRQNSSKNMDDRNKKVTWNIFVLCFCYIVCTMPIMLTSYFGSYEDDDHVYDVLLGVYWLQYGFNIALYVAQRAQYWNAYKFYLREQIIPMVSKSTPEERSLPSSPGYVRTGSTKNYAFYNF